ncbi:solute carrier organic anion transporter family member 74D-like isoform X2 [Oratosquilla oratoria]|uniref:solute carrier organic anion transporter family member 74D-like isoform X2 n=1 Tax=Oratosquilla oratoria TaxID=337810 RepID=UPI003F759465
MDRIREGDNGKAMAAENETLLEQIESPVKEASERNSNGNVKSSDTGSKAQPPDADPRDTLCGLGSCTPGWVQFLARKETYVLLYCMGGLTIGTFFTYSVAVISTIEKRFGFTSKTTGMILSGNDISQVLLAILIAYFGNYGHRPRWIAFGLLSAAISCLIAGSPHFIYGPGDDAEFYSRVNDETLDKNASLTSDSNDGLCYAPSKINCSDAQNDASDMYVGPAVMLFISQFFVGITISIYYSIGFTYLDDNIDKKEMPLYYSISMILRVVGPVLGYFMGSRCLMMWVDPSKEPNLSSRDPRWLGAWWLGYMTLGVVLLVVSTFFLFFPRRLPEKVKQSESSAADPLASLAPSPGANHEAPSLEKLPAAMKRLFTNKIWVGSLFNALFYLTGLVGYWNFKPKYLENQFRKSASEANFYTGLASLMASILGLGASGAILRWLRPGPRFVSGYAIFLTLFSTASMVLLMFIGCPKINIHGPAIGKTNWMNSLAIWNSSSSNVRTNVNTTGMCWSDCGCVGRFVPVCSKDGSTTFYSPCYAGCTSVNSSASPEEYTNCKCISNDTDFSASTTFEETAASSTGILETLEIDEDVELAVGESGEWGSAVRGFCQEDCGAFIYYLLIQIITKMVGSTGRVGGTLLHLRSVAEEDKALALGTFMVFLSLFSFIPAPIIMGTIVDSACLVWEEKCGRRGNCWFYDSDHFRVILHVVPAILIFISVLGDLVVFHYCKKLKLYGEEDDEQDLKKEIDANELQSINRRRSSRAESLIRV